MCGRPQRGPTRRPRCRRGYLSKPRGDAQSSLGNSDRYLVIWGDSKFDIPFSSTSQILIIVQLISLIWGDNWHIFRPKNVDVDSEEYPAQVLIKQASIFGPVPLTYQDIADDERLDILAKIIHFINDNNLKKPFHLSADKELSKEDRTFICKIMKWDPRDGPSAKELLEDEWFQEE